MIVTKSLKIISRKVNTELPIFYHLKKKSIPKEYYTHVVNLTFGSAILALLLFFNL